METELPTAPPEIQGEFGKVYHFGKRQLFPFSFARQTAFQRLDVGSSSPLESATMVVYLCHQTPRVIDRARGEEGCRAFRLACAEWADERKIGVNYRGEDGVIRGSVAGDAIKKIADEIWTDIASATSEPNLPDSDWAPPNPNV